MGGQGLTGPLLVPVEQMLHDLLVLLDPGEQPLFGLLVIDIIDIEKRVEELIEIHQQLVPGALDEQMVKADVVLIVDQIVIKRGIRGQPVHDLQVVLHIAAQRQAHGLVGVQSHNDIGDIIALQHEPQVEGLLAQVDIQRFDPHSLAGEMLDDILRGQAVERQSDGRLAGFVSGGQLPNVDFFSRLELVGDDVPADALIDAFCQRDFGCGSFHHTGLLVVYFFDATSIAEKRGYDK